MVDLLALILILGGLAFAVRPVLRGARGAVLFADDEERENLLTRKAELYASLKDLQFEHEMGKLSDQDYERLHTEMVRETAAVMQALDDIGPPSPENGFEEWLQRQVARRRGRKIIPSVIDPMPVKRCPRCGAENPARFRFCPDCGGELDQDAKG